MKKSNPLPRLCLLVALAGAIALALFWMRDSEVSPLEHIPRQGVQLAVIPSADKLGRDLSRLAQVKGLSEVLALLGQPPAEQLFQGLAQIVGADVRDAKSLAAIGIAADRPIFAFGPDFELPALALPIADSAAAGTWIERMAQDRLGATPSAERALCGHTARIFTVPGQRGAALASVAHGGHLYLGHGEAGAALLERAFCLDRAAALASDGAFLDLQRSFDRPSAYARILLGSWPLGIGVDLSPERLALQVRLPTAADAESKEQALAPVAGLKISGPAPEALTARLDPEAQLVAQTGIAPKELVALRPRAGLVPHLAEEVLALLDLDIDEIAAELEPGIALSARLAPEANVMALVGPRSVRGVNPFDIAHVEILAQVRDEARARLLLDRIAALAPAFGASVQRFTREGRPIDEGQGALNASGSPVRAALQALASVAGLSLKAGTPDPSQVAARWAYSDRLGKGLTFALDGKRLLVTGGDGVDEALAARKPAARAPHAIGEAGLALHTDIGALIASLRSLPESSFGIGGFAIKSSLDRWLGAFEALDALRFTAWQGEALICLDASLSLKLRPALPAASAEAAP